MPSFNLATVFTNATVNNLTAVTTMQSIRPIITEGSWHQLELEDVPVQGMDALFPMQWWTSKRENSRSMGLN